MELKLRCLFLVLAFVGGSCAPTKEANRNSQLSLEKSGRPTTTVKILSVNCSHELRDKSEVRKFARWLKSQGADIVAVQQIERPLEGTKGFDAVSELAKVSEMYQFFGAARYWEGFDSGNALFSVYPIQQAEVRSLPVEKGKVRRSLSYGVIDVGIRSIGVASTELDDDSRSERMHQAEAISSIAGSLTDYPFVVCGGFYETESGKVSTKMSEQFNEANSLSEETTDLSQRVYARKDSLVQPIAINKVRMSERNLEGVLVTFEVKQ
jgi:endonuclease/exonuclease/phosphatase family metal-dependent hydrolase